MPSGRLSGILFPVAFEMTSLHSKTTKPEKPEEDLDQTVSELTRLLGFSKHLGRVSDWNELWGSLSDYLDQAFGAGRFAVYLAGEEGTEMKRAHMQEAEGMPDSFRADSGLIEEICRSEPFAVADGDASQGYGGILEDFGPKSLTSAIWLPLMDAAAPVGVLLIHLPNFREEWRNHLRELAAHVSGSIRHCRLFEAEASAKKQLGESLEKLSFLYNIGRALNDISDLKHLLSYILDKAIGIAQAEKGSIMTHNMDTGLLSVRVVQGLADPSLQERINNNEAICRSFKPGEGFAGKVFETGEPMVANHVKDHPIFVDENASFAESIACIPMVVYDEALGVINLTNKKDGGGFTEEDMSLLKAVADQAAVAYNKHQLWDMSITDSLTGLYDRRYFKIRLMDESQRAERYDKQLSIAMADLDNFKAINDTYGHAVGDQFLIAIGRYLQLNVRTVDLVARYGGEEFIMFFPETDKETARNLAERIRQGVSEIQIPSYPGITISFGVATYPGDDLDIGSLIRKADMAMYAAKQLGRNRVVAYNKEVNQLWEA